MRLSSLVVNPYIASRLGLKENRMDDLGSIVVLVGENGCGKSRLLEAVDWLLRRSKSIGYERLLALRTGRKKKDDFFRSLLQDPYDHTHYTVAGASSDFAAFEALLSPLEGFEIIFEGGENVERAHSTYCELSNLLRNSSAPSGGHFAHLAVGVPRGDDLTDSMLIQAPLTYVDDICIRYAASSNANRFGFHSEHSMAEGDYERLGSLLSELTGMQLGLTDGQACLDGQVVHRTTFSEGQMALFRVVALLHSGVLEGASIPILLDEPERHLHPSRLIGFIDALRTHLPNAQLWIATHSLSLTAHLAAIEPRAIWFGEKGNFERAGLAQEKVVNSLLGGVASAEQISDFCVRADQFAACSFSADCLLPPGTVSYKQGDPQVQQIRDFIAAELPRPLIVVDIGAGQGRLIEGLAHSIGDSFASSISYYAIEPSDTVRPVCAERAVQHYGEGTRRVFASAQEFVELAGVKADVAVMANVLHEIEIRQWLSVLRGAYDLLEDAGSLLIVEDTRLPRGELAHANGFLILETEALCALFETHSAADEVQCISAFRGGTRLQATAFKKPKLAAVTASSIEAGLRMQLSTAAQNIRSLRKSSSKPGYRLGQEHAYHAQLLANLTLALDDLHSMA